MNRLLSFWNPIRLLLRVRHLVAHHRFVQNPTAFLWAVLLTGALGLAAFSKGNRLGGGWHTASIDQAETLLQGLWFLMGALWLAALLMPPGLNLFGQAPPRATLRPFALRPVQIVVADVVAALLDLPTLPAILLTLPLAGHMLLKGLWLQAIVTLIVFLLLGLQIGVLARLIVYLGEWMVRRVRRWTEAPVLKLLLLIGLCVVMPPAFASLTSSPSAGVNLPSFLPPTLPSLPGLSFQAFSPVHSAVRAVTATRRGDSFGAVGALGQLSLGLCLTGCGTLLVFRAAERPPLERRQRRQRRRRAVRRPMPRTTFLEEAGTQSPLAQVWAVAKTEGRLLLRTPRSYLPLRKPASLLLLGVFAFVAPDMGRDPVYNLKELLGIGALLYGILWQLQLLCNRFGNDAGTGALLFGFSVPRHRLLLGKNLALFALLLLVDIPAIIGLCFVGEARQRIPLFLGWLPLILIMLTTLGNIVSVREPFPIAPQDKQAGSEPPDALAGVYPGLLGATYGLLLPVGLLLECGTMGALASAAYMGALYSVSLTLSARRLVQNERLLIARLDRSRK